MKVFAIQPTKKNYFVYKFMEVNLDERSTFAGNIGLSTL